MSVATKSVPAVGDADGFAVSTTPCKGFPYLSETVRLTEVVDSRDALAGATGAIVASALLPPGFVVKVKLAVAVGSASGSTTVAVTLPVHAGAPLEPLMANFTTP